MVPWCDTDVDAGPCFGVTRRLFVEQSQLPGSASLPCDPHPHMLNLAPVSHLAESYGENRAGIWPTGSKPTREKVLIPWQVLPAFPFVSLWLQEGSKNKKWSFLTLAIMDKPLYSLLWQFFFWIALPVMCGTYELHAWTCSALYFSHVAQTVKNRLQFPGLGRSPGEGNGFPYLQNPYGQRSLVDYSPWDLKETWLRDSHFHFLKKFWFYLFIIYFCLPQVLAAAWGFLSGCGAQVPECAGSVTILYGLSYPRPCESLILQPGLEPAFRALEMQSLNH